MAPTSPVVAAWALGLRLREKREEAGLSGADAARLLKVTQAYITDLEKGKKRVAEDRLNQLIDTFEFDEEEAVELHTLREQMAVRGWWSKYSALFSRDLLKFFGYEHGAESLSVYNAELVPGLLQTEDYARAIIEAGARNIRLAEVGRRVRCRMERQQRIGGSDPLKLTALISESVLLQQVGGSWVHAAQLRHLADVIEQNPETLVVQVIPFDVSGHSIMGSSAFQIMSFPTGKLPSIIWQETVTSTRLIEDSLLIHEYAYAYDDAAHCSLSREDSLKLIRKASASY